jgi:hypothetical protein
LINNNNNNKNKTNSSSRVRTLESSWLIKICRMDRALSSYPSTYYPAEITTGNPRLFLVARPARYQCTAGPGLACKTRYERHRHVILRTSANSKHDSLVLRQRHRKVGRPVRVTRVTLGTTCVDRPSDSRNHIYCN